MPVEELRRSPMTHLLDALDRGEDIGHYGRLVFVMVGRYFTYDKIAAFYEHEPQASR